MMPGTSHSSRQRNNGGRVGNTPVELVRSLKNHLVERDRVTLPHPGIISQIGRLEPTSKGERARRYHSATGLQPTGLRKGGSIIDESCRTGYSATGLSQGIIVKHIQARVASSFIQLP